MTQLFISHSSKDDAFVRDLRAALADHGQDGWIDSRELRAGDPLGPEIQMAIEGASAYAVVVSPGGLQSRWLGRELRHALAVQEKRGKDAYPVIPLSLDGTRLGILEALFGDEPLYLPVRSGPGGPGGIEAAMSAILDALGRRLPAEVPAAPQPWAEPLEELVLELSDLRFHERDGIRRASARARLVYEPAAPGRPAVYSPQHWRLIAPIGPIEAEELRWYLEKYAVWPSDYFRDRARQVEQDLERWGRLLHDAALPPAHTANVLQAWAGIDAQAGRRFSVHVDTALEAGAPESETETAREAATLLLGLPWELLHDGKRYLFQGAKPSRVRRRLPGTEGFGVPVVATPIRILLITARPEDDACGYIDHRAGALPLAPGPWSRPWRPCPAWSSSGCCARRPCRRCARRSTAPAAKTRPIRSSTSTATGSTTEPSASAGSASSFPRTAPGSKGAGTPPSTPTSSAPCCAITASPWSSSRPARPLRPSRPPSRSPRSCSRSASPPWWP